MFDRLRRPKVWLSLIVGCVLLAGIMLANYKHIPEQTPLDTSVPNANGPPRPVFGQRRDMEQPKRDAALDDLLKND